MPLFPTNLKSGTIQKSSQRIAHWLPGTRRRLGSTIPAAVCDIEGTICKEVPTETEHPTEMPEMGKILLFFPKAKRMRWIQAMWERLLSQRMLLHWRDNNALSLSVLQLSTSRAIALELDNWEHAKGQACCPTFLLKDNGELEDNYARVSCCSGRGSDHERLKNFPNLPFSCMLFYSELEDNYTRASCCPWVKNGTTHKTPSLPTLTYWKKIPSHLSSTTEELGNLFGK